MEPARTQWHECVSSILLAGHVVEPSAIIDLINDVVGPLGVEIDVYLVDREQQMLRALPRSGKSRPEPVPIDTTVAGRAFMQLQPVAPPGQPERLWIPMVDGADRLGVVEATFRDGTDAREPEEAVTGVLLLASAVGYLVVAKSFYGDTVRRTRRSQPMSVGGELLWRAVPPLTFVTNDFSLAATLEPCYDVGGDAFDYAYDHGRLHLAIFDAVGNGLTAALTSTLTLAATRAARAAQADLPAMVERADEAIVSQFADSRYATGIVARVDQDSGAVQYVNAGHPPAVVIRQGRAVATLDASPRPPLGLPGRTEMAEHELEPGDRLLLYTDGITEARNGNGDFFGVDRLLDLAERHAASGLPAPETLRRLSHAVQAHQGGSPADDATLMIVEWAPGAASGAVQL